MAAIRRIHKHVQAHFSEWAASAKSREADELALQAARRALQDSDRTALAEKIMALLHLYMKDHPDDWEPAGRTMALRVQGELFWPRGGAPSLWDTPIPGAPAILTAEDRVVDALAGEGIELVASKHMWGDDFTVWVQSPSPAPGPRV